MRELVKSQHPCITSHSDVANLNASILLAEFSASKAHRILLGVGPPCQPWSLLGEQGGFSDPRANVLAHIASIINDLGQQCNALSIPFDWFVEETFMSKDHRGYISGLWKYQPTVVHAADFGHIQRSRLFWGLAGTLKPVDVNMFFFSPQGQSTTIALCCGGWGPHGTPRVPMGP